jgi:hypothetical protein
VLSQIADGVSVLVSIGLGFTTTVIFWVLLQPLAVRVSTYTTGIGSGVVLTKTSKIPPDPEFGALLIPTTAARLQANEVPAVAVPGT